MMYLVLFAFSGIVFEESGFLAYLDGGLLLSLNFINPNENVYL
jgi:hypothetical protein